METENPSLQTPTNAQAGAHQCSCGAAPILQDQFVYALGRFEARFTTISLDREFRHQEMRLKDDLPIDRSASLVRTLRENPHLAERAADFLSILGVPAYFVIPANRAVRDKILEALETAKDDSRWSVAIGRRSGIAPPAATGGILAPVFGVDVVYNFTFDYWFESLLSSVAPALEARHIDAETFRKLAVEVFHRIIHSTESVGGNDPQRAVNYVLMQHPGPLLAAAERQKRGILERIETRQLNDLGARKVIAVIFSFVDRTTGVVERLFCRIDVTEEWPFIADSPSGTPGSPVALLPYVENELWSAPL
jgi:hypothetical protein